MLFLQYSEVSTITPLYTWRHDTQRAGLPKVTEPGMSDIDYETM